jgi:hypothetical protein
MCTIDGAAIFLGTKPRNDHTQDFRSATMRRRAQLPRTLPSEVKAELENWQNYVQLMNELGCLELHIGSALEKEAAGHLRAQRIRLLEKRRKLEYAALKEYQKSQVGAYPTKPKDHEQRDWREGHFDRVRYLKPELDRLSHNRPLRGPLTKSRRDLSPPRSHCSPEERLPGSILRSVATRSSLPIPPSGNGKLGGLLDAYLLD